MSYKAITIDTSVFYRNGNKFEEGRLKKLEQFQGKPVSLVISEIVGREVIKHLSEKVDETKDHAEKTLNLSQKHFLLDDKKLQDIRSLLIPDKTNSDLAKERLKKFFKSTGAITINVAKRVEINNLIKRYFDSLPQFIATFTLVLMTAMIKIM